MILKDRIQIWLISAALLFSSCSTGFYLQHYPDLASDIFYKKVIVILLITITVFFLRNFIRINNENDLYGKNSLINYQYNFNENFFNRYVTEIENNRDKYEEINLLGKNHEMET